jgi:inner membrane transporter RhtA
LPATRERRLSAIGLVLGAACSVQGGAAVAKTLFPELGPPGVVFLRLLFGALALWAIARPQIRGRSRADLQLVVVLGVVLVSMNMSFYESIARLPLGIAVTIEFLGPLSVAVAFSRRPVDLVWVVLAGSGVALLANAGGTGGTSLSTAGIAFAAIAGLFWALYILLSVRVGRRWPGPTGLAPAMVVGGLIALPWGVISAGDNLGDPQLVGAAVGVGLLSSALPWSMELEALRRLPPAVFSVVLSLEPAVAALTGFVFLHEHLSARSWIAIGLVVLASAGAARRQRPVAPVDA